jgi:hypothetical protein
MTMTRSSAWLTEPWLQRCGAEPRGKAKRAFIPGGSCGFVNRVLENEHPHSRPKHEQGADRDDDAAEDRTGLAAHQFPVGGHQEDRHEEKRRQQPVYNGGPVERADGVYVGEVEADAEKG